MPPTPSINLLIDASTPALQIGVYETGASKWLAFEQTEDEPLTALAPLAQLCLRTSKHTLPQLDKLIYCEGPGSLLGIRLCAITLRIWKALPDCRHLTTHSYRNLALAAALIPGKQQDALIITEAGRNRWATLHTQQPDQPIDYLAHDTLAQTDLPCYHLKQRKQWQAPPLDTTPVDYNLHTSQALNALAPLTSPATAPDALAPPATKQYVTWSGQRHRAQN